VVRLTIQLPDDQHEWLRGEAFRGKTSMSRVISDALRVRQEEGEDETTEQAATTAL
jgi:hypothetical protein